MILLASLLACTPIDGDTLNCAGERVRISDIDAPEIRGRCPSERILALRARDRLSELLREPFELHRSGRNRDRYGRLLRVVTVNGRSVGSVLVGEGLARTWTGRRMPWC